LWRTCEHSIDGNEDSIAICGDLSFACIMCSIFILLTLFSGLKGAVLGVMTRATKCLRIAS